MQQYIPNTTAALSVANGVAAAIAWTIKTALATASAIANAPRKAVAYVLVGYFVYALYKRLGCVSA